MDMGSVAPALLSKGADARWYRETESLVHSAREVRDPNCLRRARVSPHAIDATVFTL